MSNRRQMNNRRPPPAEMRVCLATVLLLCSAALSQRETAEPRQWFTAPAQRETAEPRQWFTAPAQRETAEPRQWFTAPAQRETAEPRQWFTAPAQRETAEPRQWVTAAVQREAATAQRGNVTWFGAELRCPPARALCRLYDYYESDGLATFIVKDYMMNFWLEENALRLECLMYSEVSVEALPAFERAVRVGRLTVRNCAAPQRSYAAALAALNVTVSERLTLRWTTQVRWDWLELEKRHFVGLRDLRSLELVSSNYRDLLWVTGDVLEPFDRLREFIADGVRIDLPLSPRSRTEELTLRVGGPTGTKVWLGACAELRSLTVDEWDVSVVPSGWLAGCTQLRTVRLNRLMLAQLPARMLADARHLRSLAVTYCSHLTTVSPEFVGAAVRLRELDLSHNNLSDIPAGVLTRLEALEQLDVSGNTYFNVYNTAAEVATLATLRTLSLAYIGRVDLCSQNYTFTTFNDTIEDSGSRAGSFGNETRRQETAQGARGTRPGSALERVDARAAGAGRLCAAYWAAFPALRSLNYSHNKITELTYGEVALARARRWEVDLRGNPIRAVRYSRDQYGAALRDHAPTGDANASTFWIDSELECDCRSYWFARALRERPAHAPRLPLALTCSARSPLPLARGPLAGVSPDAMACRRNCTGGCECFERVRDNMTLANCSGALARLPRISRLAELRAPRNLIDTLDADNLPDTIVYLDLRHNEISRVEGAAVDALFGAAGRRQLLLAGKPLACDCRAVPLLRALRLHSDQVLDYGEMKCADGRFVRDTRVALLCLAEWAPVLGGALASVLALVLAGAVYYYRHERAVKVFLYARGWCQCWVREEDLDRDKRYDVFLTFAHADERFAVEVLLPGLEREPHALSVCVHYRDWVVGDLIPEQIARSVEESRRTVAVMSRHFLASVWTRAEFRAAHALALSEGRPRLVVVLLEEVAGDERLDDDLRAYLATNTYVKWGEPGFWDKLLYALRRRSHRPTRDTRPPPGTPHLLGIELGTLASTE